jgi:hypothetical protein
MASSPSMPPPPGQDSGAPPQSPTAPAAASPSPAQPSPGMQSGTQDVIAIVSKLRGIAKAYPATAEPISQINDLMRKVMAGMMQSSSPGEAQAPPSNG